MNLQRCCSEPPLGSEINHRADWKVAATSAHGLPDKAGLELHLPLAAKGLETTSVETKVTESAAVRYKRFSGPANSG